MEKRQPQRDKNIPGNELDALLPETRETQSLIERIMHPALAQTPVVDFTFAEATVVGAAAKLIFHVLPGV